MSRTSKDKPPDEPLVSELERGDEIYTAGLEGAPAPQCVVVENMPMVNEYRYVRLAPVGQPGAVTHYPQRPDIRVTRIRRAADASSRPEPGVTVVYSVEVIRDGATTMAPGALLTTEQMAEQIRAMYERSHLEAHIVWRPVPSWRRLAPAPATAGGA